MKGISIRKMSEEDFDVVSELAMLANPFAKKGEYRKHVEEQFAEKPELAFVASKDNKVVGYVMGDIHNGHGVLEDIAVKVALQNKGIGKLLLKTALEALAENNAKIVVAEVHYKCSPAIPFYYKYGFRMSGVCRNFFGIGQDAIIVELLLSKPGKT